MLRIVKIVFFGNVFYGLCAVALSLETSIQLGYPVNGVLFYMLVFLATLLYYNMAYITEKPSHSTNLRQVWYNENLSLIRIFHLLLTIVFAGCILIFLFFHWQAVLHLPLKTWLILFSFSFVSALYYGFNHKAVARWNLRQIGWLKPFIIGFSWAGMVSVFPLVYYFIETGNPVKVSLFATLLFVKNFMFISLLCILFDIKDYATDFNLKLKTFVVKLGVRKTLFYIILPLTGIGLGSFLTYGILRHFSMLRLILNAIPFFLLILVTFSLQKRRPILYYLVIIDGLMLAKALCGIVAARLF